MVIEQKAIVGKLKKFPIEIQQLFALGSNFRRCEDTSGLFRSFDWMNLGQIDINDKLGDTDSDRQLQLHQGSDGHRPLSQTYPQWKVMCDVQKLHSLQKRKRFKNRTIYILPLGTLDEKATVDDLINDYQQNGEINHCSNLLGVVITFMSLFFHGMEVKLLQFHDIEGLGFTIRFHSKTNTKQVLVTDILGYLTKIRPNDSFGIVGWSSLDLYPCSELNFVLGEACFDTGCAVISFGRYADAANPKNFISSIQSTSTNRIEKENYPAAEKNSISAFNDVDDLQNPGGSSCTSDTPPCRSTAQLGGYPLWNYTNLGDKIVWRIFKVLSHEVCHLLGMHHCTFFACLMNESSNVCQAQNQPLFLCPVCLRKLHKFLQFPILSRYKALKDFMEHYFTIIARDCQESSVFQNTQAETAKRHVHSGHLVGLTAMNGSDDKTPQYEYDTFSLDKFRDSLNWLDSVLKFIG